MPHTVNGLRQGESGVVSQLLAAGKLKRRLLEMGITPGAAVTLVRRAPMGDPVEVRVLDSLLALRAADAEKILLDRKEDAHGVSHSARRQPEQRQNHHV